MIIETKDIRIIFNKLIETIEKNVKQIDVNYDYYWDIDTTDCYNMNNGNPQIVVGSLYDDFKSLQKMLVDDYLTIVDIERFAHLLLGVSYALYTWEYPFIDYEIEESDVELNTEQRSANSDDVNKQ